MTLETILYIYAALSGYAATYILIHEGRGSAEKIEWFEWGVLWIILIVCWPLYIVRKIIDWNDDHKR